MLLLAQIPTGVYHRIHIMSFFHRSQSPLSSQTKFKCTLDKNAIDELLQELYYFARSSETYSKTISRLCHDQLSLNNKKLIQAAICDLETAATHLRSFADQ